MSTVKVGLQAQNANSLPAYAQGMVVNIGANPIFATPTPALAVVTTAILALIAANAGVEANAGPAEHRERRRKVKDLQGLVRQLASYVQNVSAGDEGIILSSGFDVRRRSTPLGELTTPSGLISRPANREGRARLKWGVERGADTYHVHKSVGDVPDRWELVAATTKSNCDVDGLVPGQFYWFAVSAIGAAGETSLSEPCKVMAAA
ncbi:MAG: hypothetical protein ACOH13_15885 [Flavobacteriales bacterium]